MAGDKIEIKVEARAREAVRELEATKRSAESLIDIARGVASSLAGVVGAAAAVASSLVAARLQYEQQLPALRQLGDAYAAVRAATGDLVTAQDALALRTAFAREGLQLSGEQLGVLSRAALEYSQRTGKSLTESFDLLAQAVGERSSTALAEYRLSSARAETATETLAQVTGRLREQQQQAGAVTRTLAQDLDVIKRGLVEIGNSAYEAATRGLAAFIDSVNGAGTAAAVWRDIVNFAGDRDALERQRQSNIDANARQLLRDALARRGVRASQMVGLSLQDLARLEQRILRGESVDTAIAATREQSAREAEEERKRRERGEASPVSEDERRKQRRAKIDAAGATDSLLEERRLKMAELRTQLFGLSEAFTLLSTPLDRLQTKTAELANAMTNAVRDSDEFRSLLDEIVTTVREGGVRDAAFAKRDEAAALELERTLRESADQERSVSGALRRGLGVSTDLLGAEARMAEQHAQTIIGAFNQIGAAIESHINAVVSGQETVGSALLGIVQQVAASLAREALPRSLMELAAGFAALANPFTAPTAPLHFTAAGIYGAVAAGAGVVSLGAGALSSQVSSAAASGAAAVGAARAASGATPPPAQSGGGAPVTIVVSSLVPPGPRELAALVRAGTQADRYGLEQPRPREVRS